MVIRAARSANELLLLSEFGADDDRDVNRTTLIRPEDIHWCKESNGAATRVRFW